MANMVAPIAQAISEGFKLIALAVSGADKRRLRKGMEIGERMALRIKEINTGDKKLQAWADDFFKYNN
jgi:hypothetical protein